MAASGGETVYESYFTPLRNTSSRFKRLPWYILGTGCQWRDIPKDLPPRSTLHDYLDRWDYDGTLQRIHYELYGQCRELAEREASPTAAVIDSQSVKSAEKGGVASTRMATMRGRKSRDRKSVV